MIKRKKLLMAFTLSVFLIQISNICANEGPATINVKIGYEGNHLSVALSSNAGKDGSQPHLIGHYIYVSKGKLVKEKIDTIGGNAWNFSGDHFKEVVVKNSNKYGSYQLFVTEGKDTVFNTGLIEGNEKTIYKSEK